MVAVVEKDVAELDRHERVVRVELGGGEDRAATLVARLRDIILPAIAVYVLPAVSEYEPGPGVVRVERDAAPEQPDCLVGALGREADLARVAEQVEVERLQARRMPPRDAPELRARDRAVQAAERPGDRRDHVVLELEELAFRPLEARR